MKHVMKPLFQWALVEWLLHSSKDWGQINKNKIHQLSTFSPLEGDAVIWMKNKLLKASFLQRCNTEQTWEEASNEGMCLCKKEPASILSCS